MKTIIIVGGGMGNKGAQSMTFIAVDELSRRFPQDRIVLLTSIPTSDEKYKFDIVGASYRSMKHLVNGDGKIKALLNRVNVKEVGKIKEIFGNARLMVDISGYALSSKWADAIVNYYLIMIECAQRYNIPVYVFPQSFGPFEYTGTSAECKMERIKKAMQYPKAVFAREEEGLEALKKEFDLKNVKLSYDMVIVNKGISPELIYKNYTDNCQIRIEGNAVAVLPNTRNYDHGDKTEILRFYRLVIDRLLEKEKTIYLMRHSSEDLNVCREIKSMYADESRVIVLSEDLDCVEYEEVVKKFQYLIASRYHSIIHAYKCHVPCIALGWATKYKDLLTAFEQKEYMFDVRQTIEPEKVQKVLERMEQRFIEEREIIAKNLVVIQKNNIFDVIE